MIYFDRTPTAGKWENIARDPRNRYDVYTDGNDLYINIYGERERTAEFLQRILNRLKHDRETLQKQIDILQARQEKSRAQAALIFEAIRQAKAN